MIIPLLFTLYDMALKSTIIVINSQVKFQLTIQYTIVDIAMCNINTMFYTVSVHNARMRIVISNIQLSSLVVVIT